MPSSHPLSPSREEWDAEIARKIAAANAVGRWSLEKDDHR